MMRTLLSLFLGCFLTLSLQAASHVVVLQYHHFGKATPPSTSVTLEQFDKHIAYLETNGFAIWSFEKSIEWLQKNRELPDKCVAITIDDAYISVYTEAYPRLKKRNWPFTVFVPTRAIDKSQPAFMSWHQMREMSKNGVTFGSHSHSHPYLVRQQREKSFENWKKWARDEIVTSQQRIKAELGSVSRLFAYPYGEYNLELQKIVSDLDLIGVGQHSGVVWHKSDYQALPRFPVSGIYAELKGFSVKVNSLPLPVVAISPKEPVVFKENNMPTLRLTLISDDYNINQLNCYATRQGKISVNRVSRDMLVLM